MKIYDNSLGGKPQGCSISASNFKWKHISNRMTGSLFFHEARDAIINSIAIAIYGVRNLTEGRMGNTWLTTYRNSCKNRKPGGTQSSFRLPIGSAPIISDFWLLRPDRHMHPDAAYGRRQVFCTGRPQGVLTGNFLAALFFSEGFRRAGMRPDT